jgi:hypothetical protein
MSMETQVLLADGEQVGNITLSECTVAKGMLLEELRVGKECKETLVASKNLLRLLFILSTPAAQTRRLLVQGGHGEFEVAVDAFGDTLRTDDLPLLGKAAKRIMQRAHLWEEDDGGDAEKNLTATASFPNSVPPPPSNSVGP